MAIVSTFSKNTNTRFCSPLGELQHSAHPCYSKYEDEDINSMSLNATEVKQGTQSYFL